MTSAYVRIQRDGKWQNVEFDCLTDAELDEFREGHADAGWRWAIYLAKFIRDKVAPDYTAQEPPDYHDAGDN